jgi:general secretion pathway protein B
MSFILDALKKSETERLRKDAPGIASIPHGGRQARSSRWVWLILGLLAINLVVLAGLLYKANPATPVVSTPTVPIVRQADEAPVPAPVATVEVTPEQTEPAEASTDAAIQEPANQPITSSTNIMPPQSGSVDNGLDSFNELRAKGVLSLPDMHLDIHVYSGQPADRFVFVNMTKYKENATLTEGPVIQEITADGVVLRHQGITFLLPRE